MRETGFYWIKTGYAPNNSWEIGFYTKESDYWNIVGDSQRWFPEEINETRILNPDNESFQGFLFLGEI